MPPARALRVALGVGVVGLSLYGVRRVTARLRVAGTPARRACASGAPAAGAASASASPSPSAGAPAAPQPPARAKAAAAPAALTVKPAEYPAARRDESVVDVYHGKHSVPDPYRWCALACCAPLARRASRRGGARCYLRLEDPDAEETKQCARRGSAPGRSATATRLLRWRCGAARQLTRAPRRARSRGGAECADAARAGAVRHARALPVRRWRRWRAAPQTDSAALRVGCPYR
jgi:hypothetical protein